MNSELDEAMVDDYAARLFAALGYIRPDPNIVASARLDLRLQICGEDRHAKTDICMINISENGSILLVQENKTLGDAEPVNAQPQLVAEAVAAFTLNNRRRVAAGLLPLVKKGDSFD